MLEQRSPYNQLQEALMLTEWERVWLLAVWVLAIVLQIIVGKFKK